MLTSKFDVPDRKNQNEKLIVHIIPHSHNALAHLKTNDEYYYGTNQKVEKATVYLVIDSILDELASRPNLKFSWADLKFFQMWYKSSKKERKDLVKKFVKEGRFEFLTGGTSINDDVCPTFDGMLINFMNGHKFLMEEFGYEPKVAWMLDSYGQSQA